MRKFFNKFARDERGVSAMEYAVLAGLVVLAVIAGGAALTSTSSGIPALFTSLMTKITNSNNGTSS
jgi:pilus assembly protein Flp/PilA